HITGNNALLDSELQDAVKQGTLKTVWKKLSPSGRIWFDATVDKLAGIDDPDVRVSVKPLGCTIRPEFFPCTFTELRGNVKYENVTVELTGFSAQHGPTRLALKSGMISLRSPQETTIDLLELTGSPIVPDAELVGALPQTMRKTWTSIDLKDPLTLSLNMTIR